MRTVNDMIESVRHMIDEDETSDVSDSAILLALNRAQLKLQRIGAKRWPELFKTSETFTGVSGRTRDLPTDAYGFIVHSVDVSVGDTWLPLTAVKLSQIIHEDTNATAAQPEYWAQQGNTLHLFPKASNATLRVRYQRRLPQLVSKLALIDSVTAGTASTDTRFYVDSVSSTFSTSTTSFAAFVNVIDPTTGVVKGTYQTTAVGGTYIDVGTPTRTTAYEYAVIDGQQTQAEIEADDYDYPAQDDYLCSAAGSCVAPMGPDVADYLVQYATVELKRRAGEDVTADVAQLKDLEADMENMWAGRPAVLRVQRISPIWGGVRTSLQSKYRG